MLSHDRLQRFQRLSQHLGSPSGADEQEPSSQQEQQQQQQQQQCVSCSRSVRCGCCVSAIGAASAASAGESLAAPGAFGRTGCDDLGGGSYAYLNPGPKLDGKWGYNNAGLVVGERSSLLIDTLFDLPSTRQMLGEFDEQTRSRPITSLFNTHANGDHTFGNQLVGGPDHPDVDIIATSGCASEFEPAGQPTGLARMMAAAKAGRGGEGLQFMHDAMGQYFDFEGVLSTPPTVTFEGSHSVKLDDEVTVQLIELGPAHTGACVRRLRVGPCTVYTRQTPATRVMP